MGVLALPAVLLIILVVFLPNSPRWLAEKGRHIEAEEVLRMLRDTSEKAREELNEIRESLKLKQGGWALVIVAAGFALLARRVVLSVDWTLLLVFMAMFIDVHLLTQLPVLQGVLSNVSHLSEPGLWLTAIGLSQVISNVPSTILLLNYVPPSLLLAWAVNVGGFGLLPGSLANLIALRMANDRRIWWRFHLYSIPMLLWAAELFLNDLSEKTGSHDIVRLHRLILQMNRALGMFEAQSKLWRLASLAQSSGAPVTKWATREEREGQLHLWFHCVGIRVSDQLERLLWRSIPHIIVTSATLRSLNSFSRLQEMSGLKEKAGDRFVALDSPFNHCEQGKIVIPRMRVEPSIDNEEQHIAEMAAFFREQVESKKHLGMLVLFASGRAMQRFLDYVTDLRLMLLVQGDQPRYRLVELHRKRVANGERAWLRGRA